jgi:hypothetical protein
VIIKQDQLLSADVSMSLEPELNLDDGPEIAAVTQG